MLKKISLLLIIIFLLFSSFSSVLASTETPTKPPEVDCPPSYVGQSKCFIVENPRVKNKPVDVVVPQKPVYQTPSGRTPMAPGGAAIIMSTLSSLALASPYGQDIVWQGMEKVTELDYQLYYYTHDTLAPTLKTNIDNKFTNWKSDVRTTIQLNSNMHSNLVNKMFQKIYGPYEFGYRDVDTAYRNSTTLHPVPAWNYALVNSNYAVIGTIWTGHAPHNGMPLTAFAMNKISDNTKWIGTIQLETSGAQTHFQCCDYESYMTGGESGLQGDLDWLASHSTVMDGTAFKPMEQMQVSANHDPVAYTVTLPPMVPNAHGNVDIPAIVDIDDVQYWEVPVIDKTGSGQDTKEYYPVESPQEVPTPSHLIVEEGGHQVGEDGSVSDAPVTDPPVTKDPNPNPTPDPNPSDPPSDGGGTGGEPSEKEDKPKSDEWEEDFTSLVTTKFPFSLPFDFYYLLSLLMTDPITPVFKAEEDLKVQVDPNNHTSMPIEFEVDLSWLEPYMPFFRAFLIIAFCIMLIFATRKLMGGAV